MPRAINVNVQVDRLPDVEDSGKRFMQLGIRVSASFAAAPEAPKAEDRDLLLPWKWASPTLTPGSWAPEKQDAWTLWRVRKLAPTTAEPIVDWMPAEQLLSSASDIVAFQGDARFIDRVNDEVKAIVNAVGARAALADPEGGVITGRTVVGLTETLTALPHPVPLGMKVWTVVAIDQAKFTPALEDDDCFLAVPTFATSKAAYTAAKPEIAGTSPWRVTLAPSVKDEHDALVTIRDSLELRTLASTDQPQRLMDPSTLLIRNPAHRSFEAFDWTVTLGPRLAAAIDPAARAMAVLDDTLHDAASQSATVREELVKDIRTDDHLRFALNELHAQVLAPRARQSRAGLPPSAAELEAAAIRNPTLWPQIAPQLFRHTVASDAAPFNAVSRSRLAAAADLAPDPAENLSEKDPKVPVIETGPAFADWLVDHWAKTAAPIPMAAGAEHRFERTMVTVSATETTDGNGNTVIQASEREDRAGVLDLSKIHRGKVGKDVRLTFTLAPDAGFKRPANITVSLEATGRSAVFQQSAVVTYTDTATSLTVNGKKQERNVVVDRSRDLDIEFQFSKPASALTCRWRLANESDPLEVDTDVTDLINAGRLAVVIKSDQPITVAINGAGAPRGAIKDALARIDAHALREALSLAVAGPALAGLMSGFVPVNGATITFDPKLPENDPRKQPLHVRLPEMVSKYVDAAFTNAFTTAGTKLPASLKTLFEQIRDAAIKDAKQLSHTLIPPTLEASDRITEDAVPLTFVVDQLQDFDETFDLWERLAGVGVLIGREADADKWWSLNAATLHVTGLDARQTLGATNAARTFANVNFPASSKVDPVPLVVGEVNNVRRATVNYENQSIIAEMQTAPHLRPLDALPAPRRPEAFLFPISNFAKLPPLTFGRVYHVVPYLIGHGGALPVMLRKAPLDPVTIKPGQTRGEIEIPAADTKASTRTKRYFRTVAVAAPRVLANGSDWPSPPADVAPLADELPLRIPPLTLRGAVEVAERLPARFFLDKEQVRGVLTPRPVEDPKTSAARLEISRLTAGGDGEIVLEVLHLENDAKPPVVALTVKVTVAELRAKVPGTDTWGLRVDVVDQQATVHALTIREGVHADDLPAAGAIKVVKADVAISAWRAAHVRLSASIDVAIEPPTFQTGVTGTTPSEPILLDGASPQYAPEVAHARRKVAILDGIKIGTRSGSTTARLAIARPAVSLATYDRWINGAVSSTDASTASLARTAINRARDRATTLTDERSLDDPAVEAIFVEVIQRFPSYQANVGGKTGPFPLRTIDATVDPKITDRSVRLAPVLGVKNWDPKKPEVASVDSSALARMAIKVDTSLAIGSAATIVEGPEVITVTVAPGGVYELRLYGAVPKEQPDLFGGQTSGRFSAAARALWRSVTDNGMEWCLGAPLSLTVEVATEAMPELRPFANSATAESVFAIDLARPPRVTQERAFVRLAPEHLRAPIVGEQAQENLRYAAARYVDRVALFDQRWSWRGRPQPEWPFATESGFGTKGTRVHPALQQFFDQAFVGRQINDVGPPIEASIGRAHMSGGRDNMDVLDPGSTVKTFMTRPLLLDKELDYRGGINLWRLAMRAKSRYEAMRRNHPAMVRFSHRAAGSPEASWWPLLVPDRTRVDRPVRRLDRPGLMLVVPLTETEMTGGAVPPLLAVFNERLFPSFNASDGIETVIDIARHPFIADRRIDRQKATTTGTVPTTYGELFDSRWAEVNAALDSHETHDRALQSLLRRAASATAGDITEAEKARAAAGTALEAAAIAFNHVLTRGEAWGRVARLTRLREVAQSKAGQGTPQQKQRADEILKWYEKELEAAKLEADDLEKNPGKVPNVSTVPIDPKVRFFQETSPDTIRTAAAARNPLAIRADGPIGYTFDLETEAGRFDHASLLVSPAIQDLRAWSLIKLRFRRFELPEFIVEPAPAADTTMPLEDRDPWPDDSIAREPLTLTTKPVAARLSAASVTDRVEGRISFRTAHDGLVIDVPSLERGAFGGLRVAFDRDAVGFTEVVGGVVEHKGQPCVEITLRTQHGQSGTWRAALQVGSRVHARIVISQRPKPDGPEPYAPAGDVSVRARIERSSENNNRVAQENAWLSVLCLPLTAEATLLQHDDPVLVHLAAAQELADANKVTLRPVRLSDFTPGVWCQFASIMSRVHVQARLSSGRRVVEAVDVSELSVQRFNDDALGLGLKGLRADETVEELWLRSETDADVAPGEIPQIEEPLYAVVTRYVYDGFDRLRERPVGIHKVRTPAKGDLNAPADRQTLQLGDRVWGTENKPYTTGRSGRVRFLRVLRGRTIDIGGFEKVAQEFPSDFFSERMSNAATDEPLDAPGMALGISRPIEWAG